MKLNVFKYLLVCYILALSNITNLLIQISIYKLTVYGYEKACFYNNDKLIKTFIVLFTDL